MEKAMSRMIFVNLPVRDLAASTAFYVAQLFGREIYLAHVLGRDRGDAAEP